MPPFLPHPLCQSSNLTTRRAITRDESVYPDADAFNPARWLEPSYPTYKEPLTVHPNLTGFSQFGFGRRTCQGVPIVEQDLFLTMGGMAWAFHLRQKVRADGSTVPVHWNEYTPLLIAKPKPFEFDALVRGEEREGALRQMWETGKGEDDEEEERNAWLVQEKTRKENDDGNACDVVGGLDAGRMRVPAKVEEEHFDEDDRGSETSAAACSLAGSVASVSTGSDSEGEHTDGDGSTLSPFNSLTRRKLVAGMVE